MDGYGCLAIDQKGVASASEGGFRIKLRKRSPRGWKRKTPGWVVRGLRGVEDGGCLAYSVRFPTADFQSSISERQYPQTIFRLEPLEFSQ